MRHTLEIEHALLLKGYRQICGVDEVGRGPLAGPVVAAAVVMPANMRIDGLDDSKKLSESKRNELFERIVELDLECTIGIMTSETIDSLNIHRASLMAMRNAVCKLKTRPDIILVDGKFPIPNLDIPQCSIIRGDSICPAIAAASIMAKVTRDRIMKQYQEKFPDFSFATHKGYPTPIHLSELKKFGACCVHRHSFRPVAGLADQRDLL